MMPVHSLDLAQLLHAVEVGLWQVDLEAAACWWCPRTCAIHEVPPGFRPALDDAIAFYAPQARPVIREAVARGIERGQAWDLEFELVTAKGRLRWVRARGRAARDADGRVRLLGTLEDVTERRAQAAEHGRFALVVRQMTNAAVLTDALGRITWVNPAFETLTGYSLAEMSGRTPGSVLQGPGTDPATVAAMRAAVRSGRGFRAEVLNYRRDGRPYWIQLEATPIRDTAGRLRGYVAIQSDIDARRTAEAAAEAESGRRRTAETLLRDVLDAVPGAIYAFDPTERLLFTNPACASFFPLIADQLRPGIQLEALVRESAARGQLDAAIDREDEAAREAWIARHLAAFRNPGSSRELRLPDGRWLQMRESRSASGNLVCVRTDITQLKAMEAQARRRAEEDALTGLASRAVLLDRLSRLAAGQRRSDPRSGCLVLFDIDHFKAINDSMGHQAGDAVLKAVASRVSAVIRAGDTLARLGGDEFALLMPGITDPADIERLLQRIVAALGEPVEAAGQSIQGSFSFGIATLPADATEAEALFRCADTALYQSKRLGRGRWSFFDRALAEELARRAHIAARLPSAIAEQRVGVVLQPKQRLADGGHAGFEALARWSEPEGEIAPAAFVPVAEDCGLGVALGECVMEAALRAMRDLLDAGLDPGRIAINVSTPQLLMPDAAGDIIRRLAAHGLEPRHLEIEVTETVLLDRSIERISQVLGTLRAAGVAIALDDFGTGYASLAHLTRFPVSCIKIDRRFVAALGHGGADALIAQTVIALARGLGVATVAEGVEHETQRTMLRELGCDMIQGWLVARPLSPRAARDHLARMTAAA